jgi:hypothetical protein
MVATEEIIMRGTKRVTTIVHTSLFVGCAVAAWLVTSIPSGFSVAQIAFFAGPGIVLALAGSWAGHAAAPHEWTWRDGRRAALVGAAVFPPFVALYFAWAGSVGAGVVVTLLVLSTWFTLFVGFTVALVRSLGRPKARAALAHPTSIHDDVHDMPSADAPLRIVR